MSIVIQTCIIVCISLLLFDIGFLILKNNRKDVFFPNNKRLENKIKNEIELYHHERHFSDGFEDDLMKKLSKTQNLITLMSVLEEMPEELTLFRYFIFNKIDDYAKKSNYEQAYYTYVISIFNYDSQSVPNDFAADFIRFLDSESLYTFINTMEAYYAFGDEALLLQALDKVNERGGFYNQKLLVDGLLTAKVDFNSFNPKLVDRFFRYSHYMQVSLLDFFRFNGYDIADLCLSIMQNNNTELEVRYSAMRYFTKFKNRDARTYCINLLDSKEEVPWLDQMLAIQILDKYHDEVVYDLIKEKIYSNNWYVRANAAKYLFEQNLSQDAVYDILAKRDKYANEILLYQYHDDKEMSKYIINTIQLLELQGQLVNNRASDDSDLVARIA